jgi:hypothetical protein
MDGGKIAIFDTSLGKGSKLSADNQDFMMMLLIQKYRQAYLQRTEKGSRDYDPTVTPSHTLILDEFGRYCTTDFSNNLTESSKFGLRCVFIHHTLAQLKPQPDDDRLLRAVMAIPNKLIFGNLDPTDAELLAKTMYLAEFDPDQIKYQHQVELAWPVLKWGKTGQTVTHSRAETQEPKRHTRTTDPGSRGRSRGTSTDWEGRQVGQETESEQDPREIESVASADGPTMTRSEGVAVQEGFYTSHEVRIQKQAPMFRDLSQQVFKAAQAIGTNPIGIAVNKTDSRRPMLCRLPNRDARPATDQQLHSFVAEVEKAPFYLDLPVAQAYLKQRKLKLMEGAPAEPLIVRSPGEPVAGVKLRKPFKPKKPPTNPPKGHHPRS